MSRPLYESQTDRDNEQRLAELIQSKHNCVLHKMPIKLSLDYMATRDGRAVAFFEMRQRKNKMNAYPTYMISLYKVMMANNLTLTTGLPCFLAVQWSDAAGVCNLPQEYDEQYVQMGGSTQRGDPQDIEPMVYFAMDKFMSLGA